MAEGAELRASSAVSRTTFDFATVVGVVGAFALIIAAMVLGGSPGAFVDIPSVLIVIGGTAMVTTTCFTLREMGQTARVVLKTVLRTTRDPRTVATMLLQVADFVRRNGLLSLQGDSLTRIAQEHLLFFGLSSAVDGTPADDVEAMMHQEIAATAARHQKAAGVLRKAGEVSPAMGLIGTLIGLVQMLGNLENPETIGPSMAVALLTTFYGAILANVVFNPLAAKLERNSGEEMLVNQLYLLAVGSIARQENPRRLEMLLNSVLPPTQRVRVFD